jgi:hypothetical protein
VYERCDETFKIGKFWWRRLNFFLADCAFILQHARVGIIKMLKSLHPGLQLTVSYQMVVEKRFSSLFHITAVFFISVAHLLAAADTSGIRSGESHDIRKLCCFKEHCYLIRALFYITSSVTVEMLK